MLCRKLLNSCFIIQNRKLHDVIHITKRLKYNQNDVVKNLCSRKNLYSNRKERKWDTDADNISSETREEALNIEDKEYDLVVSGAMHVTRKVTGAHNVLVIQPYVKWGPQRNLSFSPDEQLQEAEALIRSIPNWKVALSLKVPLESLKRKSLFGKGKLEELKNLILEWRTTNVSQSGMQPLTCIFISKSTLSFIQKSILQDIFNVPVMDRYSVVIQILRLHATSAEARLQVAMAEIPYIWAQAKEANVSQSSRLGYALTDLQKHILRTRERKLKQELERIRLHRKLLRKKRKIENYPVIAVVGYTNCGKTSLIKALTQEEKLQPKDRLFATLDVTAHSGYLPCNLQVVYMDTVGFMSDIPTGLIECFVATLEDALLADIILHVQDVSHSCYKYQRNFVENTLIALSKNIKCNYTDESIQLPPIINVANKIDLVNRKFQGDEQLLSENLCKVSCKTLSGLAELLENIEDYILKITDRKKITIKVKNGGIEIAWLYKNAAVVQMQPDNTNNNIMLVDVIITNLTLQRFRQQFCQ